MKTLTFAIAMLGLWPLMAADGMHCSPICPSDFMQQSDDWQPGDQGAMQQKRKRWLRSSRTDV